MHYQLSYGALQHLFVIYLVQLFVMLLFRMGLKPTEIADGYERALDKAIEVLETLSVAEVKNTKDVESVTKAIR